MSDRKLTPKQQRFVEEYVVDFNGAQAAIRAGYSKRTARQIAQENLTKPDVAAAIANATEEISERTEITQDWVIERLREIAKTCQKTQPAAATRALELIGKHIAMFVERKHVTGDVKHQHAWSEIPPTLRERIAAACGMGEDELREVEARDRKRLN